MTPSELRAAVHRLPARVVLALTLWGEARGEPLSGQTAVAWVIKNRVRRSELTVQDVCLAKAQFSCWWGMDANALALRRKATAVLLGNSQADPRWLDLLTLADGVLRGRVDDPTGGADHYLTTALYEAHAPAWAATMPVTAVIGAHTFLRARDE